MKLIDDLPKAKIKAWETGNLRFKLHKAQLHIYDTLRNNPSREAVVLCSRRFGKSFLGVCMALEDCLKNPGKIVRIIGPEIKQTTQIVVPIISKVIADAPPGLVVRTKSENKWVVGESELVLGGFDSVNIETHRGSESYSIYIEESGSSHSDAYEYAMADVLKPQLLHTRGKLTHLTTPPKVLNHAFVAKTIPQAKLNDAFFTYTIYDNPLLDEEQIQSAISDCGGVDSISFRREYCCELIKDEQTLIVYEFNSKYHVTKLELPKYAYWQTVIDWGGVRDKTVALFTYYDFAKAKRCVFREAVFGSNTPTDVIVATVRQLEDECPWSLEKYHRRWVDAPGQLQVDLYNTHGLSVTLPLKDDWEASINALKIAVKEDRWLIDESCTFLIATLESGTFNKNRTDFERSDALGHCDAIAAMMYANRMIDTVSNPHPDPVYHRDTHLYFAKDSNEQQIALNMGVKAFGTFKRGKK